MQSKNKYRMQPGTTLMLENSQRNPWKLVQYVDDNFIVLEAEDGKQVQVNKNQCFIRYGSSPKRNKKIS